MYSNVLLQCGSKSNDEESLKLAAIQHKNKSVVTTVNSHTP